MRLETLHLQTEDLRSIRACTCPAASARAPAGPKRTHKTHRAQRNAHIAQSLPANLPICGSTHWRADTTHKPFRWRVDPAATPGVLAGSRMAASNQQCASPARHVIAKAAEWFLATSATTAAYPS